MRLSVPLFILMLTPLVGRAKVVHHSVEYKQGDTNFVGYLAYDDAKEGRRPGVLVVHEWWGLNDYARKRADMLAELGYVAMAADMYGKGVVTADVKRAGELAGGLKGNRNELRARARAALDVLKANEHVDPKRVAAIGYCFGGTTVLELAYSGADLAGVVSFHGALTTAGAEERDGIKASILVCTGGADPSVPPKDVEAFQKALEGTKTSWDVITYSHAQHSFTNPNSSKLNLPGIGYNQRADRESWAHMKLFFNELFSRP